MDRIFVAIAAYRDPEVRATLDDLFARAARPGRVTAGVCWQRGEGDDALPARPRVRVLEVPAPESLGVGWARARAESLWDGEPYVLQLDAHARLADGWDEAMLADLAACPSPRAVLSGTPGGYAPPDARKVGARPGYRAATGLGDDGRPRWETRFLDPPPEAPTRVAFAEPRFVFGPAAWRGAEPGAYATDEPSLLSLRLFVEGWAVFAPPRILVWHLYNTRGDARPLHWRDHPDSGALRAASRALWRTQLEAAPAFGTFAGLEPLSGMRPSRATGSPTSLVAGDCVPFFALPDHDGSPRQIHPYGGRPTLLLALPRQNDLLVARLLRAEEARRKEVVGARLQRIYLLRGTPEEAAALRRRLGLSWTVWADADGATSRTLGVDARQEDGVTAALLTPNLRVLSIHTRQDPVALWNGVLLDLLRIRPGAPPAVLPLHAPVLMMPDALDRPLCSKLARYWESGDGYEGFVGGAGGAKRVAPEKKVRRDVDVRDADLRATLDHRLARTAYRELRKVTGFEVTHRERYKIVGYRGSDGGHYVPHRDTYFPLGHRRYSLSVALTDDFDGGGLYFPEYTQDVYRLVPGMAVMFPGTLMHGVEPVARGLRLMLVAFLYDEAGARVKTRHEQAAGMSPTGHANRMTATVDLPGVPESDIIWKVDGGE